MPNDESVQIILTDIAELGQERPPGGCINWKRCRNMTPGGTKTTEEMCDECLDRARQNYQPPEV